MKLKIIFSLMLINAFAFAGTIPPPAVLKTFNEKFPAATDVKWGMETKTEYEAEFKMDGKTISANFKEDGSWVETEMAIAQTDLPTGVMEYMSKNAAGEALKEIAVIETPEGKVYEVEIKGKAFLFDVDGKLVKEVEEK